MTFDNKTYVDDSPYHGRGLYARKGLQPGEIIGIYPTIILSADEVEALKSTPVYHYIFYVDDEADGRMRAAVAFGNISMANHDCDQANASFVTDADSRTVTLTARRMIKSDEEILVDYEEFAEEIIEG